MGQNLLISTTIEMEDISFDFNTLKAYDKRRFAFIKEAVAL
jgi:hypothetical protein